MISKRDVGAFLVGVLVGGDGVGLCVHVFYLSIILGLSLGIYFK